GLARLPPAPRTAQAQERKPMQNASWARPSCGPRTCRNVSRIAKVLCGGRCGRVVAHHTDLVAIRVTYVSAVVVRMIVLADARRPLVGRARRQRCRVEGIDRGARRC